MDIVEHNSNAFRIPIQYTFANGNNKFLHSTLETFALVRYLQGM